jgi:hypothetical protein
MINMVIMDSRDSNDSGQQHLQYKHKWVTYISYSISTTTTYLLQSWGYPMK